MSKAFKPLLADPVDFSLIDYDNCWLSPKLDGIRAIVRDGVVLSRSMKPIPNQHVQNLFGRFEHFDGELIVGAAYDDPYTRTYSGVMKAEGVPDVRFWTFDHIESPDDDYHVRIQRVPLEFRFGQRVPQHEVNCEAHILELEEQYLGLGYEGVMVRKFHGPKSKYKFGRSTAKEGTLNKLKRFTDFEARIVGIEEEMHNGNEATVDALGHTKRSSHAENKTGKGTMGRMLCERLSDGMDFYCGIFKGFKADWKKLVWDNPGMVVEQIGRFQGFGIGTNGRPRHPKFTGLRAAMDMS